MPRALCVTGNNLRQTKNGVAPNLIIRGLQVLPLGWTESVPSSSLGPQVLNCSGRRCNQPPSEKAHQTVGAMTEIVHSPKGQRRTVPGQ